MYNTCKNYMQSAEDWLPKLARIKRYLAARCDRFPIYQDLIAELDDLNREASSQALKIIRQQIESYKQQNWASIKAIKDDCCQGRNPDEFRQDIVKLNQSITKQQQQEFSRIKQEIHCQKSLFNNPFLEHNLFWQTQEIINNSQVNIVQDKFHNYLNLTVKENRKNIPLYLYLVDLYQQSFQQQITQQWHQCQQEYGERGLAGLRQWLFEQLSIQIPITETISAYPHHELDFAIDSLVYLPILETVSKVPFEYTFKQSQWFKIIVAATIAIAIFLITKITSGTGRYFGFFILVFQFINLFTGRDAKTLRCKQQSKELKRKLEQKYQALIRLATDKITQDLIAALDREHWHYQQQIEAIMQITHETISAAKKQIAGDREQINLLQRDLEEIIRIWRN